MHSELFNTIDIFTYHPTAMDIDVKDNRRWTVLGPDLHPEAFLEHIWSGCYCSGAKIKEGSKAVGFKSFPEHWRDSNNEPVWQKSIIEDHSVKKIILQRENELEVFISMIRAEMSGTYMTQAYPVGLKVHVDPAKFQAFVNNYRDTFQRKYRSPTARRDTFRITYEQLTDTTQFEESILPLLWRFLGVRDDVPAKRLQETVRQSSENENLWQVISNTEELEFCFRHTDVTLPSHIIKAGPANNADQRPNDVANGSDCFFKGCGTWSILLPICSRDTPARRTDNSVQPKLNVNRFADLEHLSRHSKFNKETAKICWHRMERFAETLLRTTTENSRRNTECIIGIDIDDPVFNSEEARGRIRSLFQVEVVFIDIRPDMYGKVCHIWSFLGSKARKDFIILLGDDVELLDKDWQNIIEREFIKIHTQTGLPLGAACVVMNDVSFEGFPTFPVVHRWHIKHFKRILPRQFVNQGGDPFLFELYSRWNASSFVMNARLKNTIGGDRDARYKKYAINWHGQILKTNLLALQNHLGGIVPRGTCLDIVIPSYRINNGDILKSMVSLRSSIHIYVRFWIVVDNIDNGNLRGIEALAREANKEQADGNYVVSVISYGENRGASYARNTGFNYSTADWVLFLDDDVFPDRNILDAYAGAINRYPDAKVMVGLTELPQPCSLWTEMLSTSNVMYFYGIAKHRSHPPWGVTANLMVRGSRHHRTVQFKRLYPKSGGGEDIDFVFQIKERYPGNGSVVSVPGARAVHPWWREGKVCYSQICGWAWGDSLCITEWPEKTFLAFPNWVEFILLLFVYWIVMGGSLNNVLKTILAVCFVDHSWKLMQLYRRKAGRGIHRSLIAALGASTVISSQEIVRVLAVLRRCSIFSFCRRMDWFDGQAVIQVIDYQIRGAFLFFVYCAIAWYFAARV